MQRKSKNLLSFKNPISKKHHSYKSNNKFKKSSTTQYNYINKDAQCNNNINPNYVNSINNNIYLNLFSKFNNTSSLKKNFSPKEIISSRINNSHISKERKNLNIFEVPSSSFIKSKKRDHPSLINSMNFIDNHGNINIRFNLKNQFINNNISNLNIITDTNYRLDMTEKVKEKDLKIKQLQSELLKSQEIIKNFKIKNNSEINKYNKLNISLNEKNFCLLTKSSESVDKILKSAFNGYISNNSSKITKKNANIKKNYKNCFLKRSGNKNIFDYISKSKTKEKFEKKNTTRDNSRTNKNLYSGNYNKKQSDYLKLFLPFYNNSSDKPRFNSYSKDNKNLKNKMKSNIYENLNKTEKNKSNVIKINNLEDKKSGDFLQFFQKCKELKEKTKNILDKYINLADILCKVKIK